MATETVGSAPKLAFGEYYGDVLCREARSGLALTELRHSSARALPEHSHAAAFFCLLLDGTYSERVEGRTLEYRPFTLGFHPPGFSHSDQVGTSGGLFFTIELSRTWLEETARGVGGELADRVELHGGRMSALATRLHRFWKDGAAARCGRAGSVGHDGSWTVSSFCTPSMRLRSLSRKWPLD